MPKKKVSESKLTEEQRRKRIGIAMTAVRHLERPADVSRSRWLAVQEVLIVLCQFLPEPYPNQETIAAKADLTLITVRRVLQTAQKQGLIERRWREHGRWQSHGYRLTFVPDGLFTSAHIERTTSAHRDRSRPLTVSGQESLPHGRRTKPAPSVSSNELTSAAAPQAAAAVQGPGGFQPQWGDTCAQCGRHREASDLDHGPNGKGWLCHDRQDCQSHQAQSAADQAEYERKRDERAAWERSPEGLAEKAAAAQAEQQREQQREQERQALRAALVAHLATLTAAEVIAFGYDHCGRREGGWRNHEHAVESVLQYFDQHHDRPSLRAVLKRD